MKSKSVVETWDEAQNQSRFQRHVCSNKYVTLEENDSQEKAREEKKAKKKRKYKKHKKKAIPPDAELQDTMKSKSVVETWDEMQNESRFQRHVCSKKYVTLEENDSQEKAREEKKAKKKKKYKKHKKKEIPPDAELQDTMKSRSCSKKYVTLEENDSQEKAREEKKAKKKEKYKKYKKNVRKALRYSWKCLLMGLQTFTVGYAAPNVPPAFISEFRPNSDKTRPHCT